MTISGYTLYQHTQHNILHGYVYIILGKGSSKKHGVNTFVVGHNMLTAVRRRTYVLSSICIYKYARIRTTQTHYTYSYIQHVVFDLPAKSRLSKQVRE